MRHGLGAHQSQSILLTYVIKFYCCSHYIEYAIMIILVCTFDLY